jgi:hypothetical protein
MNDEAVSPLRRRMIEDMTIRHFAARSLEVAKYNISVNAIAACGIDAPGDVFHQWMK